MANNSNYLADHNMQWKNGQARQKQDDQAFTSLHLYTRKGIELQNSYVRP
ncbi:hypothetical protein ACXZ1K_04700 [Pedobacter sp. PWIIR3]